MIGNERIKQKNLWFGFGKGKEDLVRKGEIRCPTQVFAGLPLVKSEFIN